MILDCQNISKSFGTDEILKQVSFHIEDREKAAIVGINGAGKSTLLKIITQELIPDAGEAILAKNCSIGYLAQYQDISGTRTIFEEVMSAKEDIIQMEEKIREMEKEMPQKSGRELDILLDKYNRLCHEFELRDGYACRSEVTGVIKGLGFSEDDFSRPVSKLSGGQKTRVFLGKLLVKKPDLLILDEPTNHLDMSSIAWLETFLSNYKGAVLIVSHDRYFLDKIVTKVIELFCHKSAVFLGNYSDYAVKKAALREAERKAWQNQQQEIKHQEEVIAKLKSFNREKSIKRAESREKLLSKMERLDRPEEERADMRIRLEPCSPSGNDVLIVTGLAKSFGSNHLFSDLSFEIKRGEKVALIGDNGTGKTTILKIISELIPFDAGEIMLGANVHIGYYDQEHQVLNGEKTLFDEISDAAPNLSNTQIRNLLALFLFTEDDVFKRVKDISGGEKGRLSLAKLMLSRSNFLILDEPTNHLDITSKEILESAICQYTGTVLFVSHDRYFINKTATRILDLSGQVLTNYIGDYDYYLEKRDTMTLPASPGENKAAESPKKETEKASWQKQREELREARKKASKLKRTEDEIAEKEDLLKVLEAELNLPEHATNSAKLSEIHAQMTGLEQELEILYEAWENMAE